MSQAASPTFKKDDIVRVLNGNAAGHRVYVYAEEERDTTNVVKGVWVNRGADLQNITVKNLGEVTYVSVTNVELVYREGVQCVECDAYVSEDNDYLCNDCRASIAA